MSRHDKIKTCPECERRFSPKDACTCWKRNEGRRCPLCYDCGDGAQEEADNE